MEGKNFQESLVQLGRDFDKLVLTGTGTKGQWLEFEIKYTGKEIFDGILNEDSDIFVKTVSNLAGETRIRVAVRCSQVGKLNKKIVVFFDPESPFYIKTENNTIETSTRKLRRQIDFQITVVNAFNKETYDFGTIKSGSKIDFEFTYLGQIPIVGVKGSCGCTNVSFDGNRVFGTLDTTDFKDTFSKGITVYLGEYERPYETINGSFYPSTKVNNVKLVVKGFATK